MNEAFCARLNSLTVYRNLMEEGPLQTLNELMSALLDPDGLGEAYFMGCYSELFFSLASEGYDALQAYLENHLRYDESPYAEAVARKRETKTLTAAARWDIETLSQAARISSDELKDAIMQISSAEMADTIRALPEWETGTGFDFDELTDFYRVNGCGMFAKYRAFVWTDGHLHPVPHPDFVPESELWGYQRQRNQVIENTQALVDGKVVNNILLYGVSGTGKSATVKAMLGHPGFESLRLIEVQKEELTDIPELVRTLGGRPQKFIVFIDDLSFDKEDKTFSSLKTILEGGLEPRPGNVAVYCTSNRRHLVRQNFSDRNGDEVDANETIQDKTSLAERFGVRILYSDLSKPEFLKMAEDLCRAHGMNIDSTFIQREAVKWDIRHSSRSPRAANQFVTYLSALNI